MASATSVDPIDPPRYRLRVSLTESDPEIWRTIDVDASLRLDELHDVIQIAMGWRDTHLHQFTERNPFGAHNPLPTIGREPLRWTEEISYDDDPGLPEDEWAVVGAFVELNGPLYYEYDLGDSWVHVVELIESESSREREPRAVLVSGERRAPLEDSGGMFGYAAALEALEALEHLGHPAHDTMVEWVDATLGPWQTFDPDALDVDPVNRELGLRFIEKPDDTEPSHPSGELDLVLEWLPRPLQRELRALVEGSGALDSPVIDTDEIARMVEPFAWLIRRVGIDGLPLSKAGWMPPAVVSDAMRELGWESRWIGAMNREEKTRPIANLRSNAERLGLLRTSKGRLLLSAAAKQMADDPAEWAAADGSPLEHSEVQRVLNDTGRVLGDLGVFERDGWRSAAITDGGRKFTRAILRSQA